MTNLSSLEKIIRRVGNSYPAESARIEKSHPFEERDIYAEMPVKIRQLFDNGHYSQATFEACKFLDIYVGRLAPNTKAGEARMMAAFNEGVPIIRLNNLKSKSDIDEQRGYKYLFSGTMIAIRNPRGHDFYDDDPQTCLDHLSIISSLLRRLAQV